MNITNSPVAIGDSSIWSVNPTDSGALSRLGAKHIAKLVAVILVASEWAEKERKKLARYLMIIWFAGGQNDNTFFTWVNCVGGSLIEAAAIHMSYISMVHKGSGSSRNHFFNNAATQCGSTIAVTLPAVVVSVIGDSRSTFSPLSNLAVSSIMVAWFGESLKTPTELVPNSYRIFEKKKELDKIFDGVHITCWIDWYEW